MTENDARAKGVAKLDLAKTNPDAAAAISKAIRSPIQNQFNIGDKRSFYSLNQNKLQDISRTQKQRLKENEDIIDIFPDIQLAEQIIISSILAPKDMFTGNLIYQTLEDILPEPIQGKINDIIRKELEGYYDITTELPEILKAAIFRTGSYVSAVIPEAAIDQVINDGNYSAESHRDLISEILDPNYNCVSIGILGPPEKIDSFKALESFFNCDIPLPNFKPYIEIKGFATSRIENNKIVLESIIEDGATTEKFLEITDNFQVIKLPRLKDAIAKQRIKRAIRSPKFSSANYASFENFSETDPVKRGKKKLTDKEFSDLIYKNKTPESQVFTIFPSSSNQIRHSIGRPLRMRIPSEAVIPVYPPGDPSNHRGYFALVDIDGNWVTKSAFDISDQGLESLMNSGNQNNNLTSLMIDRVKNNLNDDKSNISVDNMLQIYGSIVENDMLNRLKNGMYGTQFELGRDKEWDRIMLARALAGKMTRVVYLPNELVTYYAYDYHQNGVGKSYLDQVKILTSLRAILLFSKIMAEMKNAINVTKVDLKLDPEDPDPRKTIDVAQHDVMRLRESYFPLGVNSPTDLLQWIQRAGLMFTFTGHPGLPETAFDFSSANLQHQVPDQGTSDDLRKMTFMTFGLTPEQIDEGFSPQFATTIINNNAMFAKRILLLSNKTALHLSNDTSNICKNDAIIKNKIVGVLKEAGENILKYATDSEKTAYAKDKDTYILMLAERVVENVWIDLPKPNVGSQTIKSEDFNNFSASLDTVLNSFVSAEVLPEGIVGEMSSHMDEIKNIWKHHILRKWVMDEGYMPEIQELYKTDQEGKPNNDVQEIIMHHAKDIILTAINYLKEGKKMGDAINKDLDTLGIPQGEATSSTEPGDTDSNPFDFSGTGDEPETDEPTGTIDEEENNAQVGNEPANTPPATEPPESTET